MLIILGAGLFQVEERSFWWSSSRRCQVLMDRSIVGEIQGVGEGLVGVVGDVIESRFEVPEAVHPVGASILPSGPSRPGANVHPGWRPSPSHSPCVSSMP